MNARMLELYKQAHVPSTMIDPSNNMPYESKSFSAEKFAELIIRECVTVIENKMPDFTCKEEYDNLIRKAGRMDAIDEIKEHFGVE